MNYSIEANDLPSLVTPHRLRRLVSPVEQLKINLLMVHNMIALEPELLIPAPLNCTFRTKAEKSCQSSKNLPQETFWWRSKAWRKTAYPSCSNDNDTGGVETRANLRKMELTCWRCIERANWREVQMWYLLIFSSDLNIFTLTKIYFSKIRATEGARLQFSIQTFGCDFHSPWHSRTCLYYIPPLIYIRISITRF